MAAPFVISPPERRELMKVGNSRRARSEEGRRARIILDLGRGLSLRAISAGERCSVNTVQVVGKTSARHTSAEFVAFLADVVATQSADKEIHIIVDNLSAHKTKRVVAFLAEHPTVMVHDTPSYSSWLNQVEIWFSKLQRDLIARGIFESRNDLKRKIMRYIRCHNANAKPFKWTYRNAAHRITP